MTKLPHLVCYKAKGRTYHRVVRGKGPGVYRKTLTNTPGTPEFFVEYAAALAASELHVPALGRPRLAPREEGRTVGDLLENYYRSPAYVATRDTTKATYRGMLANFEAAHGHRPLTKATALFYRGLFAESADRPSVAFNLRKRLVAVYRAAEDAGLIEGRDNPLTGVRAARYRAKGLTAWSEDDVSAFLKHHRPGTVARLAFALALETAARRGDLIRFSSGMVTRDPSTGVMGHQYRQAKTLADVFVPLTATLADALDDARFAGNLGGATYLETAAGRPFTANGFGNLIRDAARAAGVSAPLHGLRKLATTRLLDRGCTPAQAMAISGHTSFQEFQKYVGTRDRRALAIAGAAISSNFTNCQSLTASGAALDDDGKPFEFVTFSDAERAKLAQFLALPTGFEPVFQP